MLQTMQSEIEQRQNQKTMINKGLLIDQLPSKQRADESAVMDIEDVPLPDDDEDDFSDEEEVDCSDDVALREKHETEEFSDKRMNTAGTVQGMHGLHD